ncbi:YaaA family protein [Agromyces sp. MMS24-K17]|uniref:YaaA family protein n=1 Tax=Agromyces sp. MMS24-K17 TaxID=3372850 RepID=UPI003754A62F
MLILLPPSETKREGGHDGTRLELGGLRFPELTRPRRTALAATRGLAKDLDAAVAALKLGPRQATEVLRNRVLTTSPVLPAIDRYDGVLYDALGADTLDPAARAWAGDHVAIGSALFGLVGALDPIPAYRLSYDSRLPEVRLKDLWPEPARTALAAHGGLLLDLRSKGYAALGPLPARPDAVSVRVVSEGADGRRQALNHFNKAGKGALVRRLVEAGIDHPDVDSLLRWAVGEGVRLEPGSPGELDLVV